MILRATLSNILHNALYKSRCNLNVVVSNPFTNDKNDIKKNDAFQILFSSAEIYSAVGIAMCFSARQTLNLMDYWYMLLIR